MQTETFYRFDDAQPHEDQRLRRSDDRREAFGLQLDQIVRDFALGACVLFDEEGAVLAASWRSLEAYEQARHLVATHRFPRASQLAVRDFLVEGRRYLVAAVGGDPVANEISVYRAILGVRRIHTNTN